MTDINTLPKKVDELIFYLDDISGKKLFREIKQNDFQSVNRDQEKKAAFMALQFLIIPFLSISEVGELFKNNLFIGLSIDDMDLSERVKKNLVMFDVEDRDKKKEELKKYLLNNREQITDDVNTGKVSLSTVSDWIKDYTTVAGEGKITSLNEANYYQKTYFKNLEADDKKMLKKLFALYRYLATSSLEPEGFEDDLLLRTEDGKMVTTEKGKVVVLHDPKKVSFSQKNIPVKPLTPPKTLDEKEIDELKREEEKYAKGSLEREAIEEAIKQKKEIERMEYLVNKYPEGSLERRALEEEIKNLRKKLGNK